jgi:hypothetical protein
MLIYIFLLPERNDHNSRMSHKPKHGDGTLRGGLLIKSVPSYYSASQALQWLSCIGFPERFEDVASFFPSLENLEHLTRLHLLTFPFENTEMH